MTEAKTISRFEVAWATRKGGGGRTERRHLDFVVEGQSLATLLGADLISVLGWGYQDCQSGALDRLLRRAEPDVPNGRNSIYVCPECGDLGCGAITALIAGGPGVVVWSDFGFQTDRDDEIRRHGFENIGPFTFDGREYHTALERVRTMATSGV